MLEREPVLTPLLQELSAHLERVSGGAAMDMRGRTRPWVTLSYAQSLDGSIAVERDRPLSLSCPSSLQVTHELRAAHDAILVGIGTVLADNPLLNVRLVSGPDPQPIVVDSQLRIPQEAHLLGQGRSTWLAATETADPQREARIRSCGAEVLRFPELANGWVDLEALLQQLAVQGISHLLVEGGSRILTSFMTARLADYMVLTVSPRFVGGVSALSGQESSSFPRLSAWRCERCGDDLVLAGELSWSDA